MVATSNSIDSKNSLGIGDVLAEKYKLLRRLGQGAMGAVWEAEHVVVSRHFAIKFLNKELLEHKELRKRFESEAKVEGMLQHENIIAVTDFGFTEDGTPFFVMEYLEGCSLRDLLQGSEKLPVPRAVDIVIQACRGIDCAHTKRIIHRDLKPENLFIARRDDGSDWVKILDFGIAKIRESSISGFHTKEGYLIGTFHYMAQEQLGDATKVDNRSDVYALGVILYEMLSLSLPHPSTNLQELVAHIVMRDPLPLSEARPDLPQQLIDVIHKAIARDPTDRFQTAREFMTALVQFSDVAGISTQIPRLEEDNRVPPPTDISVPSDIPSADSKIASGEPTVETSGELPTPDTADSIAPPLFDPTESVNAVGASPPFPSTPKPLVAKGPEESTDRSATSSISSETEPMMVAAALSTHRAKIYYALVGMLALLALGIVTWFWTSGSNQAIESSIRPASKETKATDPSPIIPRKVVPAVLPDGLEYPVEGLSPDQGGRPEASGGRPHVSKSERLAAPKSSKVSLSATTARYRSSTVGASSKKRPSTASSVDTDENARNKSKVIIRRKGQRKYIFDDTDPFE